MSREQSERGAHTPDQTRWRSQIATRPERPPFAATHLRMPR